MRSKIFDHVILISGVIFLMLPVWLALTSSTHSAEYLARNGIQFWFGDEFISTYRDLLFGTSSVFLNDASLQIKGASGLVMLKNSLILGFGFAIGKIMISMLAAYAIVYFRFPLGTLLFWIIFSSLLLPLEVRIIPSYEIVAQLGMVNSYTGLILPLIASATATFFFRQFFLSIPDELIEAAKMDNAGPWRFFIDILLPLSKAMIAAIFIIMFVVGWNQYLWPILMTTDDSFKTLLLGIKDIINVLDDGKIPAYNRAFALAVLSIAPPVLVVVLFQKWFIKGLVDSDK
ncbi:carbohydrate ABC transporter membrane protein 2, CUT1 family [Pasteurella testudinis DSM 23072]|uniref:sn-glycerol-3-phosphate transport system permease protein UgpE n=1 Tax=Pasteurella testudinis DSM 23072 TaxID=1122938 RepID=A0A1W1UFX3_9PAST|nr:ABC transporter permease subunit [Pasteurella testudinis]SMB79987.1 carbohydrate ABC transporter membrane protein 2, CUT1 family [Pasteurella testudinis DSM 23072]SUB50630.1 Maltose transport system permease protein malG [Pasteurella testudinis]